MNKLTLTLFTILLTTALFAENASKNTDTKLEKVTVFLTGAQVSRTAKTNVSTGKTDIVFTGLSPYIVKSSITVEAKGATVVSVNQQINHLNEQKKQDEVSRLQKRLEELSRQIEDQASMKDVYQEQVDMLEKNQQVNSDHTDLKTADLKAAMDYHLERMTQLKKELLTYTRNIKKLTDSVATVNLQLKTINAQKNPATSDITVTVSAKQAAEAGFVISYFVSNAGWYPTYDVRVEDISKPLNLQYRANVHQSTGEEWKDIKMTLSNGEPMLSSTRPELKTWYVSNGSSNADAMYKNKGNPLVTEVRGRVVDENGEAIPYANIMVNGTSIGTTTDDNGNYSLNLPEGGGSLSVGYVGYDKQDVAINSGILNIRMKRSATQLEAVEITSGRISVPYALYAAGEKMETKRKVAEPVYNIETSETYSPTTFSYEIEMPYTIPNDGKNYTVDIKQQEMEAEYQYITAPRIEKAAFLVARIANWDEYNLLSGEASLYFEGTYIGKSLLNTAVENDTMEISLGRDKSVTVTRTKLKDQSKKSFFGDKVTASRGFEINVRNNKRQPIHILVQDQIPVSTQKEIEISKEYKDAKIDETTGILTWTLDVPASSEKKNTFNYSAKYPKTYRVQLE